MPDLVYELPDQEAKDIAKAIEMSLTDVCSIVYIKLKFLCNNYL